MSKAALRKISEFSAAALDKLESSGISEEQAKALGMYCAGNASLLHAKFEAQPALVLPYFGTDGKPLAAHPSWPQFYRLRYLGEATGFKDITEGKKRRYAQPPDTGVCAYFPTCTDWKVIQDDPTEPVLITEGELKAAKACLEGFPCIGLGGVYNFKSSRQGVFFLPELEAFKWVRRRVTIVYDSDYVEKSEICAAINALAEELQERGALVELATLPDVFEGEQKTGLDDFLVSRNDEELIRVLRAAEPIGITARLWQMNEEVVYVQSPGLVVVQKTGQKMRPDAFISHSKWATANTPERRVGKEGDVSYEKVPAAPVWIKWPLRRSVAKVTYRPGQERFCEDERGAQCYNQWEGWGCEPSKGDVKPWRQLCEFIFEGAEPGFLDWFYDWCAYPLQNPGVKLFSAVVVHGRATGTGKSLIGYTLGRIYGKNFTKIENKHLTRDFNGWAENRQFVLGDEISGSDKRSEADAMKTVITQEELSINIKMLPEYTVPDCINYYFTSNHADAFFVEDKDRRYAIHEVQHDEPLPLDFYMEYDKWKAGSGPAALFYWLLQRDLSKFNPRAPAPHTAAKKRMTMHGKSDVALWCAELREAPDTKLRVGQLHHVRDLFTSTELLAMYEAEHQGSGGKVTANGLARAMTQAGFRQVNQGNPIPANGKQGRYFIVRNYDQWKKPQPLKVLTKHIEQSPVRR